MHMRAYKTATNAELESHTFTVTALRNDIYIYIYINFKLVGSDAVVGVLGNERGQSVF